MYENCVTVQHPHLTSPIEGLLLDNFLLDKMALECCPCRNMEHVIPAPASRLLGFAESQPNLYMLWCIRAKARFGSSLSPQPEGWGY
ncbi:MAG: hypothetical protein NUV74_13660, partial [Candidatus Brocadiaceae bacterium]|nr:hypothetical protein [Candidatus Brocadiaceae bacterium]